MSETSTSASLGIFTDHNGLEQNILTKKIWRKYEHDNLHEILDSHQVIDEHGPPIFPYQEYYNNNPLPFLAEAFLT